MSLGGTGNPPESAQSLSGLAGPLHLCAPMCCRCLVCRDQLQWGMAAKKASANKTVWAPARLVEEKKRNKGVHAKRNDSRSKSSKNYRKAYRGQGRA